MAHGEKLWMSCMGNSTVVAVEEMVSDEGRLTIY
jgi:hypothetical protein